MINKERLINNFVALCRISSPSRKERDVADYIKQKWNGKFTVLEDGTANAIDGNCGNLCIRISGTGDPLIISAHLDTVVPCENVEPVVGDDGIIRSAGDTILGADDKAAIAAIMELVEILDEIPNHRPIEIILSVAEEVGLLGANHFDTSILKSKEAYIIDTSQPPGNIVNAAPVSEILTATITGKAAHAGIAPENGISSIQTTALAVSKMKLGRIADDTTANIGIIKGGLATNIIPEITTIEGEIRSHDINKMLAQKQLMDDCLNNAAKEFGATVNIQWESAYTAYTIEENSETIQNIKRAADKIDLPFEIHAGGGGSDANVFNKKGIESIVLGCGMTNVHSTDEQISVKDLVDTTRLIIELVR